MKITTGWFENSWQISREDSPNYMANVERTSRGVYAYTIHRKVYQGRSLSIGYPDIVYSTQDFKGNKAEVIAWVSNQIEQYEA